MNTMYIFVSSIIAFYLSFFLHRSLARKKFPYLSSLSKSNRWGKIFVSGLFAILTIGLLFKISHQSDEVVLESILNNDVERIFSILIAVISGIIVILLLPKILERMQGKISHAFFVQWDVIVLVLLIIFAEFGVLNWLKEIDVYVFEQYLDFVLWYSLTLIILGTMLGWAYLTKVCRNQRILTCPKTVIITLLSQILIVSCANILMLIMWYVITHIPI